MLYKISMKARFILLGLLSVCSFACSAFENDIPLLSIKNANWTSEEVTYIKALNQKGSIKIATKISSAVYVPLENDSHSGFHYSVLKDFTDLLKVDIEIKIVAWNDYFYKKGEDLARVKADQSYSYVPSLIEDVDLYVDGITVLAWREKMFDIIKYIPSRQMLISRIDNKPSNIAELHNKSCVMVNNTSMEINLEKIKKLHSIDFNCIAVNDFDAMDSMVSEGKVDFTVFDSDRAFAAMHNYENLTILWPISELQIMGWAINKNNKILKSILQKYIKYAQENAILDKYWKRSYGVTFFEYLKVLNLRGVGDN
ncbi:MAG: transporter substrate-binding domain-containing protein [Oceanospirillaceae bacterium]